jgi:hypothetical protein
MKFAALTFLTTAIVSLPSSSAIFAAGENLQDIFGEQEASVSAGANDKKHFSWNYTAAIAGTSGDISGSECTSAFDTGFVEAWNEVNPDGDVQAEGCSVSSVAPGFLEDTLSVGSQGGKYYYNGGGDYS